MLARSFLTPEELNISDKQFDALVQVLGMLERGELPWHSRSLITRLPTSIGFNMDCWPQSTEEDCGSVGCIGYWCQKLGGDVTQEDIRSYASPYELKELFYPVEGIKSYQRITVDEGIQALSNYLTTGRADWAGVLA